jgi:hypothetical protein
MYVYVGQICECMFTYVYVTLCGNIHVSEYAPARMYVHVKEHEAVNDMMYACIQLDICYVNNGYCISGWFLVVSCKLAHVHCALVHQCMYPQE